MTQIPKILRHPRPQTRPTQTWREDMEGNTVECEGWGRIVRDDVDGGGMTEPYFEDGVKCFLVRGDVRIEITAALTPLWIETVERNWLAE